MTKIDSTRGNTNDIGGEKNEKKSWLIAAGLAISLALHAGVLVGAARAPEPPESANRVVRVQVMPLHAQADAASGETEWVNRGGKTWAWVSVRKLREAVGM